MHYISQYFAMRGYYEERLVPGFKETDDDGVDILHNPKKEQKETVKQEAKAPDGQDFLIWHDFAGDENHKSLLKKFKHACGLFSDRERRLAYAISKVILTWLTVRGKLSYVTLMEDTPYLPAECLP